MTGNDPYVHGVRYNGAYYLGEENLTLAEALRDLGYSTAAELGSFVLNSEFGMDQGFEQYHDLRQAASQRKGEEVADDAIARMRQAVTADRPFFLFAHFFDPHQPYEAPAPFAGRYSNAYVDEVAYTDAQVGRLLAELDALGVRERTLVVLTGDHGESLGEHGEETHSIFIYDATTAVPLILSAPGRVPSGARVASQVRLIDVAPTIMDFVGGGEFVAQGASLVPALADPAALPSRPAYSETLFPRISFGYAALRSLRDGGWKYIHAPTPELYDLGEDPGELRNLAEAETGRLEQMREQLRGIIAAAPVRGEPDSAQREVSDEERAKLEALGYVGGSSGGLAASSELEMFEPQGVDPKERVEVMARSAEALALQRSGDLEAAEAILRELLASQGAGAELELASVHDLYAKVLYGTGRFEEAIEEYRKALRADRPAGEARTNLGAALLRVGRPDEAAEVLAEAVTIQPVFASTYSNYGSALLALERFAESAEQFRAAMAIDPGLLDPHVGLGSALAAMNRTDEAIVSYRRAIELYPEAAIPRRLLGELMISLNRSQEALEQYEVLVRLTPDDARAVRGLGLAYFQMRQPQQALPYLQRSVELDPSSARAWYSLSGAQAVSGRLDAAIQSARRAVTLARDAGETDFASRIQKRIGEYEKALQ